MEKPPCSGLFALHIESKGLCLYAQIHMGFAVVFGGAGTFALMCMSSIEQWPAPCVVAVAACLILAMGPEGLLTLGALLAYRTLRRHRLQRTHMDPAVTEAYGEEEEEDDGEGGAEERVPAAGYPVGVPVQPSLPHPMT